MEKGALTFELNAHGRKLIDVAELVRVYGEIKNPSAAKVGEGEEIPQSTAPEKVQSLEQRIKDLETQVDDLKQDKQDFRQEREGWKMEKEVMQGDRTKLLNIIESQQTLLLPAPEDNQKVGWFRRTFGGKKNSTSIIQKEA